MSEMKKYVLYIYVKKKKENIGIPRETLSEMIL